ncbi:MAG: putative phage abortive infection protein [Desulfamplus sp.]|nr:putative phage abortive infection protein [Desulfamplus sp.]
MKINIHLTTASTRTGKICAASLYSFYQPVMRALAIKREKYMQNIKELTLNSLYKLMILIFFVWLISGITLNGVDERGTFGDMFGAINALFSGFAFAGVIFAILLQRQELELQRKELELTRNELEGQKLQLQAQNETFKLQNFENTFFQLLRLHNEIINSIDLTSKDRVTAGRDCFVIFYSRFKNNYMGQKNKNPSLEPSEIYNNFYPNIGHEIGHYFRYLYNIIKFVKRSSVADKRFYTNLVRAQLSDAELLLLFYNCLSKYGVEKFKPMVEEFALFKNLPEELLIDPDEHHSLFSDSAYGKPKIV